MNRFWVVGSVSVLVALALGACTWTRLQATGEPVAVLPVDRAEQTGCEAIGTTTARTTDQVWLFARSPVKVRRELETLARNEAGRMGGDAIRALGAPSEGEQRFSVLRCGENGS